MATGGSGDVLTGLIAALLGQRLEPFAAAQLGTHLHGLAGDLARADRGEVPLIATGPARLPAADVPGARSLAVGRVVGHPGRAGTGKQGGTGRKTG